MYLTQRFKSQVFCCKSHKYCCGFCIFHIFKQKITMAGRDTMLFA